MREIALHVLDVLQNAVDACATRVVLTVCEDRPADWLTVTVADNGRGMDAGAVGKTLDPFYSTRTTRHVGLGLPLLAAAAERAGGGLSILSAPGEGTTVEARFRLSHPDRQPLGDMAATVLAFLLAERSPDLRYVHRVVRDGAAQSCGGCDDAACFEFDSAELRAVLGDVPLAHPAVVRWLGEHIGCGVAGVQPSSG